MSLLRFNRVLAIDVGSSGLKLAEMTSSRKGVELLNFGVYTFKIEPGSDIDTSLEIVDGIRSVLSEKSIRPAPVILSVTGQSAFMRLVKLPPVKQGKIHQTVEHEALQNVPFPINEVVWDYQLMEGTEGDLNVMLVAIKTNIVEALSDCVEAAGLDLELVDVGPMSLYNAVRYNYEEQKEGCTLIIDVGARATNLVFVEEGRFFCRNLPVIGTGNGITQQLMKEFSLSFKDAEELKCAHASVALGGAYEDDENMVVSRVSKSVRSAMTRLHVEVERSINFYRTQQGGSPPQHVMLAGGTSLVSRMDEFFREKLRLEVDYFNPFKNIFIGQAVSADEAVGCSHLMGEVVGAGLRYFMSCPLEINLLPQKNVAEKAFRRKQPYLVAAGFCLALVLVCWGVYFSRTADLISEQRENISSSVAQLEAVNSQLRPVEQQKTQLLHQTKVLSSMAPLRAEWLKMLDSIHSCLLDGMWLVSVTPVSKGVSGLDRFESMDPVEASRIQRRLAKGRVLYTHIKVEGMIFADKATDRSIADFRDKLRMSESFSDGTDIEFQPPLHRDDYAREFIIEIELAQPLI